MTTTEIPENKNIVLVFDVETTGLIPRQTINSIKAIPMSEYPHIIQFSFILYDIKNDHMMDCYDSYIKIPDKVEISPEINLLTGITNNICESRGQNIVDAIISFYNAYKKCNCLIAHNITFDQEMIMIEIQRNREEIMVRAPECFTLFHSIYEKINSIEKYCTMRNGINICNIIVESKTEGKPPRKKWPKLGELHSKLFNGEEVEGLHNSLIDIITCLKCYMKMRYKKEFSLTLDNIYIKNVEKIFV